MQTFSVVDVARAAFERAFATSTSVRKATSVAATTSTTRPFARAFLRLCRAEGRTSISSGLAMQGRLD
jgi:hypothetical protein